MTSVHLATSLASALVPLLYGVVFVLALAPGYALARAVVRRRRFDASATLLIAYAISALAGYLAFWCYFLSPRAGRIVSEAWLLAGVAALVVVWRGGMRRDEAVPAALTFLTGLFYLAVLYLPGTEIGAAQRFFVFRPQDNLLPQIFAEHLFHGVDPRHAFGDWQSSDRPPLQTGLALLVRPLFRFAAVPVDVGYEIAGAVAQLAWVPAMWLLCARIGLSARQRAVVLAFAVFSGFFLYNTVYAWPKLLAAGMSVAALVFALPSRDEDPDASLLLAGACAALALLAHGGAVFFVVPALLVLIAARRLPLRRGLAWGALAAVLLVAPWAAYQRFYDPPGDRLLKMHLAGINGVDPRPAGTAIAEAYAGTPPDQIARNKLANAETVLGAAPLLGSATTGEPDDPVARWRMREREHVTAALGFLGVGWLALPWLFARRGGTAAVRRGVAGLLGIAGLSALLWSLALWGPGGTVTTHSAYALDLVLYVALGAALAALPARVWGPVLALAVADLLVTWIAGSLGDAWRVVPALDPLQALIAVLAAAATAALLRAELSAP